MRSRFLERARQRQRARIPRRAARYAASPKPPAGAILRYRIAMGQVGSLFAEHVQRALAGQLDGVVSGTSQNPAVILASARRTIVEQAGRVVSAAAGVVAERALTHSKTEFDRLGIVLNASTRTDAKSARRPLGVRVREAEPKLDGLITTWRRDNVDKITSLVGRELDTIEGLLREGEGRRVEALAKEIEQRLAVTRSKAELLARDQTLKLNAAITGERQQAAGITHYVWTVSGDERVRDLHAELDGKTFAWDDPPITNKAGERNHPGEDYQCRCTAYPVLPELGDTPEPEVAPPEPPGLEADPAEQRRREAEERAVAIRERQEAKRLEHERLLQAAAGRAAASPNPIVRNSREFRGAMASQNGPEVRRVVRDQITQSLPGSVSQDVAEQKSGRGEWQARSEDWFRTTGNANADAFHEFGSGRVVVQDAVREKAALATEWLEQGLLSDPRLAALVPGDVSAFANAFHNRLGVSPVDALDGLRVIAHEEIHGFSRSTVFSYRGIGAILEEVGTELNARHVVRTLTPEIGQNAALASRFGSRATIGAYQEWINDVCEVVARHAQISREEAGELVRVAHQRSAMAGGPRFASPSDQLRAFIHKLDVPPAGAQLIQRDLAEAGL